MPTGLYDSARQAFLDADIDWTADTIKGVLIDDTDYTVNLATDDFLDDVPGAAIVGTATTLTGKSSTAGVADAADLILTSVSGDQSEAILIYKDTGVAATSNLIAYIDSGTGLPITPNGGDITIAWSDGANKIFKL